MKSCTDVVIAGLCQFSSPLHLVYPGLTLMGSRSIVPLLALLPDLLLFANQSLKCDLSH